MALFSQRRGGRLHEGNLAVLLRRLHHRSPGRLECCP